MVTFASSSALAAPGPDTASNGEAASPKRAVVYCACEADDAEKLQASLAELLTRLGIALTLERVTRIEVSESATFTKEQVALAWVDIRKDDIDITLGFRKRDSASLLLVKRKLERANGAPLALEAAAHVLQAAIEDALEAEKAADVAPPVEKELPKERESDPRRGVALDVGAAFGGRAFGSDAPFVFGGGALAKLSASRGQWSPALSFSGTFHVAFNVETPLLQVQTQVLSLRLLPSLTFLEGSSWSLEGGAGGGVDLFFATPRSSIVPMSALRHTQVDPAPILTAFVTARLGISESADVFLTLGADADLAPSRYVTETNEKHTEVFTPGRIRPFVLVGFAFTAFGPKPYAASPKPQPQVTP